MNYSFRLHSLRKIRLKEKYEIPLKRFFKNIRSSSGNSRAERPLCGLRCFVSRRFFRGKNKIIIPSIYTGFEACIYRRRIIPDDVAALACAQRAQIACRLDESFSRRSRHRSLSGASSLRERRSAGSSLKFCVIAEGEGDVYPRFAPTMEWDTAAGDAVLRAAGGVVLAAGRPAPYGKLEPGLRNGGFVAWGDPRLAAAAGIVNTASIRPEDICRGGRRQRFALKATLLPGRLISDASRAAATRREGEESDVGLDAPGIAGRRVAAGAPRCPVPL